MKKITAFFLVLVIIISLFGCTVESNKEIETTSSTSSTSNVQSSTEYYASAEAEVNALEWIESHLSSRNSCVYGGVDASKYDVMKHKFDEFLKYQPTRFPNFYQLTVFGKYMQIEISYDDYDLKKIFNAVKDSNYNCLIVFKNSSQEELQNAIKTVFPDGDNYSITEVDGFHWEVEFNFGS